MHMTFDIKVSLILYRCATYKKGGMLKIPIALAKTHPRTMPRIQRTEKKTTTMPMYDEYNM